MKYNFPISILFSLPFVETLTWSQVSGCLCQTFHHAGVCSCRGGTQGLLPQLGKSWELVGTPKSFKIYFTLDAHQSKRSKRIQKIQKIPKALQSLRMSPGDFGCPQIDLNMNHKWRATATNRVKSEATSRLRSFDISTRQ